MKKFIFTVILICCSKAAWAQGSVYSDHTIRVKVDAAFPLGKFKETDFEDEHPAFAKEGTMITASYLKPLHQAVLVGGSVHYRFNKFDMDEFVSTNDKLVLQKDSKPYRSWFTMADVYLQNEFTGFFIKGSAGTSFNKSAHVEVVTPYGTLELPADHAAAFAWGYGIGVSRPYDSWGILIELTHVNTTPTFTGKSPQGGFLDYKLPMDSINFGIALSYSF